VRIGEISFREYLRVGVPVGLTTLAIGGLWLPAAR
jgi:hypothetical protein